MNDQFTQFIDLRRGYLPVNKFTISDWHRYYAPKLTLKEEYNPHYWAWNMFHPMVF